MSSTNQEQLVQTAMSFVRNYPKMYPNLETAKLAFIQHVQAEGVTISDEELDGIFGHACYLELR